MCEKYWDATFANAIRLESEMSRHRMEFRILCKLFQEISIRSIDYWQLLKYFWNDIVNGICKRVAGRVLGLHNQFERKY